MQALRFHYDLARIAAVRTLGPLSAAAYTSALSPMRLVEVPEPPLPADDWVRVSTTIAGICGSDLKQCLCKGSWDNPMTALVSFPQTLGHEAVGRVAEVGPAAADLDVGTRVVLNPWLTCAPRAIDPPCPACARGELTLCRNFTRGALAAGIHHGTNAEAGGAFAPEFVAHRSQLVPVPDSVSDEQAVLADPFSVSLHSVLRRPPAAGAPVLVYGLGPLGLGAVAALGRLYPDSPVYAVGRHDHQKRLALAYGAREVIAGGPEQIVRRVGELAGSVPLEPWHGLPWLLDGVAVVYDTVGTAESIETALRVVSARGAVVVSGVEAPARFEWTPLYFKEVDVTGSNAFAVEEIDGRRAHAIEFYLDFVADGLDLSDLVTHRFALADWRDAFATLLDRKRSGAIKVVLAP